MSWQIICNTKQNIFIPSNLTCKSKTFLYFVMLNSFKNISKTIILFCILFIFSSNSKASIPLTAIFKKNPDKEILVKVENNQSEEKTAKFEMTPDTLQDPYDQIRSFVNAEDMNYFNQLKTHIETKDSVEQIRCKAVIYAILQDKELNEEQRQTLALAYFERLTRMPWSNYRFRTTGNKKYEGDTKYGDRRDWYSGYKKLFGISRPKRRK